MMNIDKIRQDTPGCTNRVHFNNAGSSFMPTPVHRAVTDYLDLESTIGGYEAEAQKFEEIRDFYSLCAEMIGAKPEEIAFTEGATRSWEMAFLSLPLEAGDTILTSYAEYSANYLTLLRAQREQKLQIRVIDQDETGQIDLKKLEQAIDSSTRMICLTHIPTSSGLINPAEAVGEIAQQHDLIFLLDACQSIGQIPLDVSALKCDILCATGRKYLRGPRGTGFLYIRESLLPELNPPFIGIPAVDWKSPNDYQWRSDARKFECHERSFANQLGLSAAIQYYLNLGPDSVWIRIQDLSRRLRKQLGSLDRVQLHDIGKNQSGIVTFSKDGIGSLELGRDLLKSGFNVVVPQRSFAQLDFVRRNLEAVVRASIHYYNTDEEIDRLIKYLDEVR